MLTRNILNRTHPNAAPGKGQFPPGTIAVRQLGKTFSVAAPGQQSVREVLQGVVFGGRKASRQVTALREMTFTVAAGDALGVVGRNGSGKSTLLKLLAGTMYPDSGTLTVGGRVSALIDLAAGFHPEFSGRENIFLSGTILGARRADMQQRFDRIVAFAELHEFIDVPVKYYSTGMFARLGFAVASSVESDVLLIDEVLAVGDGRFQTKCLKKLEELREQGTTLLFVSHNLELVRSLCSEVLWLEKGTARVLGPSDEVLDRYRSHLHNDVPKQTQGHSIGLVTGD